ncbi:alpha/beta hydrolase [Reichenbachiella sp.]
MVRNALLSLFTCVHLTSFGQINNLNHADNYETVPYGSLGSVEKIGNGKQPMILIAGWGFDGNIFRPLTDSQQHEYTMYVVTLPGFGNTKAPPMPKNNTSYSDLYWTNGIIQALKGLIQREQMNRPILMSYFTYSNVIALRIALDYPELIDKVVILSGMARFMANYPSYEPTSLQSRIYYTEQVLAQKWFKTVSKETWDQGNFTPVGFSKDTLTAQKYWNQMSSVPIPIMVRYLLEYYCTDLSLEYEKLKVPTLVVMPQFTQEVFKEPGNAYWSTFFHHSWWGAKPANSNFHLITISDSHAMILEDQPDKLLDVINLFASGKLSPYDLKR